MRTLILATLCAVFLSVLSACGGGGGATRPGYNLGTGFFVLNSTLYDANGTEFRIRGVNANHWWGYEPDNEKGIGYIKAANANSARIVFGPDPENKGYLCQTTEARRSVVKQFIDHKIVPIVEYHNATGSDDPALVDQAANLWIGEPWVKEFEKLVIVNITNEWATQGHETLWKDTYIAAIQKLRAAGVNNTLVIDSIQYGQGTSALLQYGKAVFDADPQKNVVFSLHMYGGWLAPTDPAADDDYHRHIDKALQQLSALGLPLIVGEFNHEDGSMDDTVLINELERNQVGWLGWMFFNSENHQENMINSLSNPRYLTDFGNTLVGFLGRLAEEATVFGANAVPALPVLPPHVVIDPSKSWNPGPVSLRNVTEWWMEASIDQNVPNLYRIDFEKPDGSLVKMEGWGTNNYKLGIDKSSYLNHNVRFWLYSTSGAVAKTKYGPLSSGTVLEIAP